MKTILDSIQFDSELQDRLVRYCAIDTPSDDTSATVPSSEVQFELLRLLENELNAMGASNVKLTDYGCVIATIPSTIQQKAPVIALLAHVDTTTQFTAVGVKPLVHAKWNGTAIVLPDDPSKIIDPADSAYLATKVGEDIITASGKSLLGADDKAGVAIIMAMANHLLKHPEIGHGEIRIVFTPDEEIGTGVRHVKLEDVAADYAYTLDGGELGKLCFETFSADKAVVKVTGVSIHPGYAKDKMVNALHLAAKVLDMLPAHTRTPDTTDGKQGFIHATKMAGGSAEAEIQFILRDFELDGLESHAELLRQVCRAVQMSEPRSKIDVTVSKQYRNMRYWLENDMRPVDLAATAMRNVGIEPIFEVTRGGTDGSQLTERGLPTPNLFTGMQNIHGPLEWISVQDMSKATLMCLELVQLWAK